jgi:hypothetical protein
MIAMSELGIDPKTREHRKIPLTAVEGAFLSVIWVDHVGRENCISADAFAHRLAVRLGSSPSDSWFLEEWKRGIRFLQNHLLCEHNIPVYSAAGKGGGYWIGESRSEGNAFFETFRKRGLTGMVKASRGKKSAMVDMVTQIAFQFDELVDKAGLKVAADEKEVNTAIEIVDVFLKKMTADPERFSEGLKKISKKYGSVLVPKDRYDQIIEGLKAKSVELSALASALEH